MLGTYLANYYFENVLQIDRSIVPLDPDKPGLVHDCLTLKIFALFTFLTTQV